MTPFLLGLIGLSLAYPVPEALARFDWPYSAPRASILLWQSLALAAVLAMLGAGLSTALLLVTDGALAPWKVIAHFGVLALTAVVMLRLAWTLIVVFRETRQRRGRQRSLVDVLATRDGAEPGLRILEEETPVAFCLPHRAHARVIVTRGALDNLSPAEWNAVLEHERAHVRRRHDLVLEGFIVLHQAFPRLPGTDRALRQSQILVELLADDAARRISSAVDLARALVTLAAGPIPAGSLGAGTATLVRLNRLESEPGESIPVAVMAYVTSIAVLIIPTVGLALPWALQAWSALS